MNEWENFFSSTAKELSSLSISSIAAKVNEKKTLRNKIYNFTIGDFSPEYFPIPAALENEIVKAYRKKLTNYPVVGGMSELIDAISSHIKYFGGFKYNRNEIITGSGSRVLTYLLFRTLLDKGNKVVNVVPSWNNYNYIRLAGAGEITVEAKPENNFLVTADQLKPHIKKAALIALNSPSNPAGTVFSKKRLREVFDLINEENKRRKATCQKPLFVFFDIVYWLLTFDNVEFINPLSVCGEAKDYTVFVDGISKCFSATGVRVGWAFGPEPIIRKMKQMIAHVGGWSPKPEQIATANFLNKRKDVSAFLLKIRNELFVRLQLLYECFLDLRNCGLDVEVIPPQGALYLSVKINLKNKSIRNGSGVAEYLLEEAGIAVVPFYAFGASEKSLWMRISVGTSSIGEIRKVCKRLKTALKNKI